MVTKLEKMLKYVTEHNEFYKSRIKEYGIKNPLDITQWPVLTRKELQGNRYNMFSDGYKSKYFDQQLRRQSSSGSSGTPVNVYWDYNDWYSSNMSLWRKRLQWYGIKPSDKYCVFTLNSFGITPTEGKIYYINKPSNILMFNVSLVRDESGYEQMAKLINDFKPDWLYIQPFVLNQLIRAYRNLNLVPCESIKYVESVGEILTSDLRKKADELFNVKVTNMYGSEEMNGIAIEDPNREMHILTDNVFFEVESNNGISPNGNGESIITNLNNHAMPIIRYMQGDMVSIQENEKSPIISSISGRTFEVSPIDNGKQINSLLLSEVMSKFINQFPDTICSYRFVYNSINCNLYCIIGLYKEKKNWFVSIAKELELALNQKIMMTGIRTISVEIEKNDSVDICKRSIVEIKK